MFAFPRLFATYAVLVSLFVLSASAVPHPQSVGNSLSSQQLQIDTAHSEASLEDRSHTRRSGSSTVPSGWSYLGCFKDSGKPRPLPNLIPGTVRSVTECLTECQSAGYAIGGVEFYGQCWCGNVRPTTGLSTTACNTPCASGESCGGAWWIDVYQHLLAVPTMGASSSSSAKPTTTSTKASSTTSKVTSTMKPSTSTTATSKATTTSKVSSTTKATSTATPVSTQQLALPTAGLPSSNSQKFVCAHHMVGNTYSYTQSTWANDISLASSGGIDGFALNMGSNYWQPDRIADAYAAAAAAGSSFKLFFSFDMTSMACANDADAAVLRNLVTKYWKHPNQAYYKGHPLVSTFAGENCHFGEQNATYGWQKHIITPLAQAGVNITFVPSMFLSASALASMPFVDGALNWDGGWPMGSGNLGTTSDTQWISALGSKAYMAAVSPFFFTYYGPNTYNKDWIYRSDDWLLATRFEALNRMRQQLDLIELISWNDYGESHYIGPIRVDQPNSQGWTNGMDHTALLPLIRFYASAFKTGAYPSITKDQAFLWSRPHSKNAVPTNPTNAKPTRWQATDDNLYATILTTAACQVTLTAGSNTRTFNVAAGVTHLSVSSSPGTIAVKIIRNGQTVANYDSTGAFTYTATPTDYNFNYFVAST